MSLDETLEKLADTVEQLIRKGLKPSDDSYHRVYVRALARILARRGKATV
jgi:hypothetical protein